MNNYLSLFWYFCLFTGRVEQVSTKSNGMRGHLHKSEQKPTRVRTVLNEKQLHTLRTCYNANPRPDALMKEQLVEMTGLSPRVIRVWFQNKRCKDKKRSIMMKQIQQQQQEKVSVNIYACVNKTLKARWKKNQISKWQYFFLFVIKQSS